MIDGIEHSRWSARARRHLTTRTVAISFAVIAWLGWLLGREPWWSLWDMALRLTRKMALTAESFHYVSSILMFLGLATVVALPPRQQPRWRAWLGAIADSRWMLLAFLVAFLFWRLPTFCWHELNMDESQEVAEALSLLHIDPIFWRSTNGGTHGPVVVIWLLLARLLGMAVDPASARLMGALAVFGSWALIRATVHRVYPRRYVDLALLPALFSVGWYFTSEVGIRVDFLAYNGELTILLLNAASFYLLVRLHAEVARPPLLVAAGLALGAAPYAKLQGVPVAALLALLTLRVLLEGAGGNGRRLTRGLGLLAAGLLAPTAVFAGAPALLGGFGSFWRLYIGASSGYVSEAGTLVERLAKSWGWLAEVATGFGKEGLSYILLPSILASIYLFVRRVLSNASDASAPVPVVDTKTAARRARAPSSTLNLVVVASLTVTGGALFAAMYPGRGYHHYYNMVLVWAAVLVALAALDMASNASKVGGRIAAISLVMILTWLLPVATDFPSQRLQFGTMLVTAEDDLAMVAVVKQRSKLGEPILVWGLEPKIYAMSGRPPVGYHAVTGHEIYGPERNAFRARLLADVMAKRPVLIIDSVRAGTWQEMLPQEHGIQTFPELVAILTSDYQKVGVFQGCTIWERRDRLASR